MEGLDAYFARIGWGGATSPGYDTLAGLLRAHLQSIPFENLDVLLGRRISLDLADVAGKLVTARRGGYCFEHATLFAAVLESLGFALDRHLARVVLLAPWPEAARSHMFLVVRLREGRFVVDPGFGGPAATVPLPLDTAAAGPHRMHCTDGIWTLETPTGAGWASRLEEAFPIDFEMSNHYKATHPSSPFVNRLMMSRFTEEGRVTVLDRDVTVREGGSTERLTLPERAALRRLLTDRFGFDLSEVEHLRVPAVEDWH